MIKVMFVCHGNICRSPMAEMIMKDLIRKNNLESQFLIASSATSTEEIWGNRGNPIYPPAKDELRKRGIPCEPHHAVLLQKKDYQMYDLLIGMDSMNIKNMLRITGGDPDHKIRRLLSYTNQDRDVADPWYSGKFGKAYDDIALGCNALLNALKGKE